MLIYGFLLELWLLNLNEEEEEKKKMKNSAIIAQYIYDGEDLGHPYIQSTTVLCDYFKIDMGDMLGCQDAYINVYSSDNNIFRLQYNTATAFCFLQFLPLLPLPFFHELEECVKALVNIDPVFCWSSHKVGVKLGCQGLSLTLCHLLMIWLCQVTLHKTYC